MGLLDKVRHHGDDAPAEDDADQPPRVERTVRWVDDRLGLAKSLQGVLGKIFPNHWSFLLGEVALYSFVVLLATGVYLTFFFDASAEIVTYDGSYEPLQGAQVSQAYNSAMDLSFDVRAGLVMRQMHHWAALIFLAAITVHLMRVFFTGAFRRPREINWIIGVTLFALALGNGMAGYSLLDDQLSGTGLRIMYSIAISIPVIGTWIASLIFGGQFPGDEIIPRLYIIHVLLLPAVIAVLIGAHLAILVRHKHAQFPGKLERDDNVVGERLWPTYAAKAGGYFFLVTAIIAFLGGVAQINAIWITGPFKPENVSSASQPDWYVGWLEGALRLFPPWEIDFAGFEIPNPFFPGILLMGLVFNGLYMWPFLEARFTKDRAEHHVLQRPREHPVRTGIGAGIFAFFVVLFLAGANDVITVAFGLSINQFVFLFRILVFVVPPLVFLLTFRLCKELVARERDDPSPYDDDPDEGDLGDAADVTAEIEAEHEAKQEADRLEATEAVGG
jgi:ubiquinol-cytochrome c reductase cytochrome b subunit